MRNPYRRALAILALNLSLFMLARLLLLLVYTQDFHALGIAEIGKAFAHGLMFDLSIIALVTGLPLLLLLLPLPVTRARGWQSFWTWVIFGLLVVFILLLSSDLLYFGFVHRHVGPEITALGGDTGLLVDMALGSYAWAMVLFVVGCIGLFFLWRHWFPSTPAAGSRPLAQWGLWLVAILAVAFFIRGGLVRKPLDIVDAFADRSPAVAYLSLNGPFAMSRSLLNTKKINADFFSWDEAVRNTQTQVLAANEQFLDSSKYPLLRRNLQTTTRKPNIVLLMLESWDAQHIDRLRRDMQLKPYGVTPNFDALSTQGLLFTHFYANGERSMDGLAALLAGIPTLPGTAYIGMGMEQNRMGYLGQMAQQEGYNSIFLQSSKRSSFHVDSIAGMAGFLTYLGAEDIPATGHSAGITERGAWDYDTLQEANRLFAASRKPFLGFVFTASTHLPFQSPGTRWTKYPPDSLENRFLNSLYYADWAIGEFIASAKKAGYYDNTIFIFTADHVSGFAGKPGDVPSLHHIPLLIIAPGLKPAIDAHTGGQIDVLPTLAQLAGWRAPQAGLGHSLLDKGPRSEHGSLCVRAGVIERIEDNGWVAHDLTRRIGSSSGTRPEELDAMERRLLSMYQVGHTLLLRNRIFPTDTHDNSR